MKRSDFFARAFLVFMVFFSIFIIVNTSTATSFLISESNPEDNVGNINFNKKLSSRLIGAFEKSLNLISSVLTINQIGFVSAVGSGSSSDTAPVCCITTKTGAACQDVIAGLAGDYCETSVPTSCDQVSQCKIGCCIDESEGLCSVSSTKQTCEVGGGNWKEGAACLINECQRGCCVLGENVEFVTDNRCSVLSAAQGLPKDFRDYANEAQCIALKTVQETGACTFANGNETSRCTFGTELECASSNGQFHSGMLCSNPTLNTECEKQASTGCYNDKDEIYWYDSCGNRENIYSSNKEFSWNNGFVLGKKESCNPFDSNADSKSCGNCNYFLGTKCSETAVVDTKIQDGNFICEDLSCVDENGNKRENGESWCTYDSQIGEGKDTPGSRHWKQSCIDGEIQVEACADYRGQICVEDQVKISNNNSNSSVSSTRFGNQKTEGNSQGKTISNAACVINEASQCIQYASDNNLGACQANSQCQVLEVNVDDAFQFQTCAPQYPRGFDLSYQDSRSNDAANALCSAASLDCTVIYVKQFSGWECVANCDCETDKFGDELNNLCIAQGDCGTYVNYIGDGTNNVKVDGAPSPSWKDYRKYAQPKEGQYAKAPSIQEVAKQLGFSSKMNVSLDQLTQEQQAAGSVVGLAGTISGAMGYFVQFATQGGIDVFGLAFVPGFGLGGETITGFGGTKILFPSAGLGAFASALSGFGIGATVGAIVAKVFGLQGQAALAVTISGAIAGGIAGYAASAIYGLAATGVGIVAAIVAVIVAIVVALVLKFLGIGETKEVTVSFECLPWQAPTGGSKCDVCNNDPLKPCSKYRCESLGQACRLLNENSANPVCAATKNDGKPPVISFTSVSENYTFVEKSNGVTISKIPENTETSGGTCLIENKPVNFEFETDKFSQCKWNYQRGSFDSMNNYFNELNFYGGNHTGIINLPNIEGLASELNITLSGDVKERFADISLYARCQDSNGNVNSKDYEINFCLQSGPDLNVPKITKTFPENNAILKYGTQETLATFYLNEPAECKWSLNDTTYGSMENPMICNTQVSQITGLGWTCNSILPVGGANGTSGTSNYFVKCRDQPWLGENSSRNVNQESYKYTLSTSKAELNIDSIKPNGTISEGFEPIEATLEVKTSGGSENGKAICAYRFAGNTDYIQFKDTFSTISKQVFTSLVSGSYVIEVKCEDESGNVAEKTADFNLAIDSSPPKVIRAYKSGNNLKLVTDEKAECYFDYNRCNFDFRNATLMTVAFSTEHTAEWNDFGGTYHVKCIDIWGNQNQWCAIQVTPSSFI